jgi:hypothetical protein
METTGDLRAELARVMVDVRAGKLNVDKAAQIIKAAAVINDSLYSEMKVAALATMAGAKAAHVGTLSIAGPKLPAIQE